MLQTCSAPRKIVLMKYIYIYLHFISLLIYLFNSLFRLCIVHSWVYFHKSEATLLLSLLLILSLLRLEGSEEGGWGGGGVGRKGSLLCDTPAKKLQNLRPAASKVMILRLQHHQDSQVVIYIDAKLWTSKVINQNAYFGKRWHN